MFVVFEVRILWIFFLIMLFYFFMLFEDFILWLIYRLMFVLMLIFISFVLVGVFCSISLIFFFGWLSMRRCMLEIFEIVLICFKRVCFFIYLFRVFIIINILGKWLRFVIMILSKLFRDGFLVLEVMVLLWKVWSDLRYVGF